MKHASYCPYCMNPVMPGQPCKACGLTAGSYTPLPHHLPPGTVLKERYLIGRVLGEGGFGITYIGCDLQLEVKLAIKEYFPVNKVSRNATADLTVSRYAGTTSDQFDRDLDRFLKEARTMAKLSKQHTIVTVHDFFRDNNTAYIVMEYIDGTTFKDLAAQRGGRIPAWELLHLIEPLFFALQTMHDAGLIHRDISPENIMLEDGVVRLLDFGCTRDLNSDKTMTISLKHSYAPVEQYQGKGQGPWTDVYALGSTIYYCLTGIKPPQAMDRLVEDELILPRKLGVDLTESQEKALLHAMRVRPRQRYQSMTEFHTALYEGIEVMPNSPVLMTTPGGFAAGAAAGTPAEEKTPGKTETDTNAAAKTETESDIEIGFETKTDKEAAETEEKSESTVLTRVRKLVTGICAAVIALVLISVIVFISVNSRLGTDDDSMIADTTAAETDTDGEDITSDYDSAASYTIEDGVGYISNGEEAAFTAALADPDVESIVIEDGIVYITGSAGEELYSGGALMITKPVTVTESGGLTSYCPITLDGVSLTLDADAEVSLGGILRTVNGGSLVFNEGSAICNNDSGVLIWLESENDIVCADGASEEEALFGDLVVTLNTDALFEGAVEVTTQEELEDALSDPDVSSVEITADITLTQAVTQGKPVRVAENVTLIVPGGDQLISEDGTITEAADEARDESWNWIVDNTTLVNCGTIIGDLYECGDALLLNEEGATIRVSGQVQDSSVLINCSGGSVTWTHGWFFENTRLYNLGTFTAQPYMDYTMNMYGVTVYNSGTFTLCAGTECSEKMTFYYGAVFDNIGTLEIGTDAHLYNAAEIYNIGTITAIGDGAVWENDGIVWNGRDIGANTGTISFSDYDIDFSPGSAGVVVCYEGSELLLAGDAAADESTVGRVLEPKTGGEQVNVSTQKELLDAINDNDVTAIWLMNDITLDTDEHVYVDNKIIYGANESLTVATGTVLFIMENAALIACSVTCPSGEELGFYVDAGSTVILRTIGADGGILVRDGSLLLLTGEDESIVLQNTHLTLVGGSALTITAREIAFENSGLYVGNGGDEDNGEGNMLRIFGDYSFDEDSILYVDEETGSTYHLSPG